MRVMSGRNTRNEAGITMEMQEGVEGTSGRWGAQEDTTRDDKKSWKHTEHTHNETKSF